MYKLISNEGKVLATFDTIEAARQALQERPSHHSGYIQYAQTVIETYENDELGRLCSVATAEHGGTRLYRVLASGVESSAISLVVPAESYDDAIESVRGDYPATAVFDAWLSH